MSVIICGNTVRMSCMVECTLIDCMVMFHRVSLVEILDVPGTCSRELLLSVLSINDTCIIQHVKQY